MDLRVAWITVMASQLNKVIVLVKLASRLEIILLWLMGMMMVMCMLLLLLLIVELAQMIERSRGGWAMARIVYMFIWVWDRSMMWNVWSIVFIMRMMRMRCW